MLNFNKALDFNRRKSKRLFDPYKVISTIAVQNFKETTSMGKEKTQNFYKFHPFGELFKVILQR